MLRTRHRPRFGPLLAALALMLFAAQPVAASPIVYNSPVPLLDGVPVMGVNTQEPENQVNPVGAEYFAFFANAGSTVTVTGTRLAPHYDMSLLVFAGLFTDTTQFAGGLSTDFDANDPGFIDFADDEIDNPGPFGDPQSIFVAPTTGFYTVAVTNFSSDAGPPNPFSLQVTGISAIPEPASLALFGLVGVVGLCVRKRRKAI